MTIAYRWAENAKQPAAGAGRRPDSPTGRGDRRAVDPFGIRRQGGDHAFRSSLPSATIRSSWVLSPASPGLEAMQQASIMSMPSWRQSGSSSCVTWSPGQRVWPCWSIPPIRMPKRRWVRWRRLRAPWDFTSRSSKSAPAARSMPPSRLVVRERTDALFVSATPCSPAGAFSLRHWRRIIESCDLCRT